MINPYRPAIPKDIIKTVIHLREVKKLRPNKIRDITGLPLAKIYNICARYGSVKRPEKPKPKPETRFNFWPDNIEVRT